MFCGKCGKRLIDGNIFCTGCGAIIVREEATQEAAAPPVRAVAIAAPPPAATTTPAAAEFTPVYADETPAQPNAEPEPDDEQVKKNMQIHVAVFAAVALLLLLSMLVFNPMRVRYDVVRDGYGQILFNEYGQEITEARSGGGAFALFTRPAPYGVETTAPEHTQPGQEQTTTAPPQIDPTTPTNEQEVMENIQRGVTLNQAGQFAAAITFFNNALAADPNNLLALSHRGTSHFNLGNFHDAINDLTHANRIADGNEFSVLFWRGASYFNIGFHAEAVADLTGALALQPDNINALEFRGRAHEAMGNHAAAVADQAAANALRNVAMQ